MEIVYSHLAAAKCHEWAKAAKDPQGRSVEIGWMQEVTIRDDRTIYIPDVHLFEDQSAHGSEVVITADMVAVFYDKWIAAGKDPKVLLGWGHSHGDGGVFQSGPDKKTSIDRFGKKQLCVSCTWNIKGEVYADIHIFRPLSVIVEKVSCRIEYPVIEVDVAEVARVLKFRSGTEIAVHYGAGWSNDDDQQESLWNWMRNQNIKLTGNDGGIGVRRESTYQHKTNGVNGSKGSNGNGAHLPVISRDPKNGYTAVCYSGSTVEFTKDGVRKSCDIATWMHVHDHIAFPAIQVEKPEAGWAARLLNRYNGQRCRVSKPRGKKAPRVYCYYIRDGEVFRGKPQDRDEKRWSFRKIHDRSVEVAEALKMFMQAEAQSTVGPSADAPSPAPTALLYAAEDAAPKPDDSQADSSKKEVIL